MFYRIFVHCVGPRQYVLYVESFIKTTIFKEVESVSVYHATCHCWMRWRKHPIHYWEQTKQTRSKKVETFTLNPYLPEDSFIFIGLAVNWLKMNGHGSFKNPEISAASARKSFLVILNRHDVKHWKIFAGFKKTSKKANIDARQNNWTFRGWRGMHDALINYPISPFEKSRYSTIQLKKKNINNNRKSQKNPSSFFLQRGNRHFTILQKGMGEWRVENGRTTDYKDKISVTLVFSFVFFP